MMASTPMWCEARKFSGHRPSKFLPDPRHHQGVERPPFALEAHGFAAEWYKNRHGVSEDAAWLYAASFWRAHVDQVLDFLAFKEALDEQERPERN